jgi:hypothetical protein
MFLFVADQIFENKEIPTPKIKKTGMTTGRI